MARRKSISDEHVIDMALDLLVQVGPQGFTLAALGAQVGLSAATLVQRFGTRAALLDRAVARSGERLAASAPAPEEVTVDGLVSWLVAQSRGMETRQRMAGHMALLMEDLRSGDGRREALANAHMREMRRQISGQLRALQFDDPDAAARMLEAHWHGLLIQWGLGGKGSLRAWVATGLRQMIDLLPRQHHRPFP